MFKRRIGIFYRAHDGLQHRSGIGQHGRRFGYSGHYLCPLDVWRIRANSAKTGGSRSTIVVLRPVFSIDLGADNRAAHRRSPIQRVTGLPDAVVFLALPNAYPGVFSGAALVLRPPAWGLSIWTTPPATRPIPAPMSGAPNGVAEKMTPTTIV